MRNDEEGGKGVASPERRSFMKAAGAGAGALAAAGTALHELSLVRPAAANTTGGEAEGTPIGEPWWPSRWGADDQAGASNWMTPDKALEAAALIRQGRVFDLSQIYDADMPLFGSRAFALRIPGAPTGGVFGRNKIIWNDEFLATEIGQVGTQFDGLGHIGVEAGASGDQNERRFYNGFTLADMASPYGLQKLGVEQVKPFFTPGTLIDVAGARGGMLDAGEEISVADLQAALERQGLTEEAIAPGDVVLIHTGWSSLWGVDNERYVSGEPGVGVEAGRWLAEKEVCLVGGDCWAVEVVPNPDGDLAFPVHQEWLVKHGIYLHENLRLAEMVEAEAWRFAYVYAPVRIRGATGSPGSPLAVI